MADTSGNWVRVGADVGIATAAQPSRRRRDTPPRAPSAGSSSSAPSFDPAVLMEFITEKFSTMTTYMNAEYTGIRGEIAAIDNRLAGLDQKVTLIEKRQQDFHLEIIDEIKRIDIESEAEDAAATEEDD